MYRGGGPGSELGGQAYGMMYDKSMIWYDVQRGGQLGSGLGSHV